MSAAGPALRWDHPDAAPRVSACVAAIEAQTGAEVVVSFSAAAGRYRWADLLVGALGAGVGLLVYLFAPQEFPDDLGLVLVLAGFAAGASLSALVAPVRRLVVGRQMLDENARRAACERFVDLGVSVTRARSGLLVAVSRFEQRVDVVADVGVPTEALGARWSAALAALQSAAAVGVEPFLTALAALGPLLAEAVPRRDDDVNELSDEVNQA